MNRINNIERHIKSTLTTRDSNEAHRTRPRKSFVSFLSSRATYMYNLAPPLGSILTSDTRLRLSSLCFIANRYCVGTPGVHEAIMIGRLSRYPLSTSLFSLFSLFFLLSFLSLFFSLFSFLFFLFLLFWGFAPTPLLWGKCPFFGPCAYQGPLRVTSCLKEVVDA